MVKYTMKDKPIMDIKDVIYCDFHKLKLEDYGIKMNVPYSFILSDIDYNERKEDYYNYYLETIKDCDCAPALRHKGEVRLYLPIGMSISSISNGYNSSIDYNNKGQFVTFKANGEITYIVVNVQNSKNIVIVI